MITIKQLQVNMPEELQKKAIKVLKELWIGMPLWLRYFLVITVICGAVYFLYIRVAMSFDVANLQTDIANLNGRCATTVFYDRYQYDIQNVVTSVKTLEEQLRTITMLNHEMLKIIQESHPSPETRTKLKQLEHQYDYAMKSYEMIITH